MHAVIFEVTVRDGCQDEYLAIAARLREKLSTVEGFISIERFQSLVTPGKLLSLSYWKNEQAILNWKAMEEHKAAQEKGRQSIFEDYRICVAHVERDYTLASSDFSASAA